MTPRPSLVIRRINADTVTPIAAVQALHASGAMTRPHDIMLFESVLQGAERGRYSCIVTGYRETLRIERVTSPDDDIQGTLRAFAKKAQRYALPEYLPSAAFGVYGYIAYDGVRAAERLPDTNPKTITAPDVFMVLPETILLFDNATDTLYMIAPADNADQAAAAEQRFDALEQALFTFAPGKPFSHAPASKQDISAAMADGRIRLHTPRETFENHVRRCKEYILAGDAFQIVPSQRFSAPLPQEQAFSFYRILRGLNPSPYCFYIDSGDAVLTGCSPETLVRLADGALNMRPIAGTRPRGATMREDAELAADLLADEKECAEHLMLVDLCRNDIGRVSEPGSVTVPEMYVIEQYSHVMHIVSHVTGTLRPEIDAIDALFAALPVGTVSGAPKVRAMEIIDALEQERRGFYAGGAGYISANGDTEFCITLRSAMIAGDTLYMQAGAGIVADSDPAREYEETVSKASALFQAYLQTLS